MSYNIDIDMDYDYYDLWVYDYDKCHSHLVVYVYSTYDTSVNFILYFSIRLGIATIRVLLNYYNFRVNIEVQGLNEFMPVMFVTAIKNKKWIFKSIHICFLQEKKL